MNSLQELNSYGNTTVNYTDNRPAGIIFDRSTTTNQIKTINQHDTHGVPTGIEIVEVIRAVDSTPTYTINVSTITGATVSWATVPTGCTVTNPSTGVYRISGVNSKAIWDIVKSPTITLDASYVGTGSYTATITYNTTQTKSWTTSLTVIDITNMDTADDFYFLGGVNGVITGNPIVIDNYPTTWNVTVTPSSTTLITSMSTAGSGGTSSFNATTKVLSISGTKTQVNSHLNTISYVIPDTTKQDFTLQYVADNVALSEGDSKTQQLYTTEYLSATRAGETYQTNTATTISNGPVITHDAYLGTGFYSLTITPSTTSAVSTMSAVTPDYYPLTSSSPTSSPNNNLYFKDNIYSKDLTYWAALGNYSGTSPQDMYIYKRTGNTVVLDATVSVNLSVGVVDSWQACDNTLSTVLVTRTDVLPNPTIVKERSGSSWSTTYTVTPDSSNVGYARDHIISPDGTQFCVTLYSDPSLAYPKLYFYAKSGGTWSLVNMVTGYAIGQLDTAVNSTFFSSTGDTFFTYNYTTGNFEIYKKTSGTWAYSQSISASTNDGMYSRLLPDGKFARYNTSASTTTIYSYSGGTWSSSETRSIQYPYKTLDLTSDLTYYASGGIVYKSTLISYEPYCYIGNNSLVTSFEEYSFDITDITSEYVNDYDLDDTGPWVEDEENPGTSGKVYTAGQAVNYGGYVWIAQWQHILNSSPPSESNGWKKFVTPLGKWRITVTFDGIPDVNFPPIPNGLGVIISGATNTNFNAGWAATQASANSISFWWKTIGDDGPGNDNSGTGTIKLVGYEFLERISSNGNYIIRGSAVGEGLLSTVSLYTKTANDPNKTSFNNSTKVLTLQGPKSQVNDMVDTISFTPATGYASDFLLTYTVTTPTGYTDTRSQDVDHTS